MSSLQIFLPEIISSLANVTWKVRAGNRCGEIGEKLTVVAGKVPIWIKGAITARQKCFDFTCHFEIEVADGSSITLAVPSQRLRRFLEAITRLSLISG